MCTDASMTIGPDPRLTGPTADVGSRRGMADEEHQPQTDPQVQARIKASFDRQGLMGHLGARLEHIGPGRVSIVLPRRPEVTQQHGYVHAGATSAIADSAGGYAALT